MADTKEKKGKNKKNKSKESESKGESREDGGKSSTKGDGKKSKSKDKEEAEIVAETLASFPLESNGTDNMLNNFTQTEDEKKNEDDGIRRPSKWHTDEIRCDQLCLNCLKINYYWPPRPRPPTPPDKDPNLIYPGDVDPNFKPARGDILMVHPRGLGLDPQPSHEELWWRSKRIGGGFCICYDGDKKFKFEVGDLILRMGTYVEGDIDVEMEVEVEGDEKPLKEGSKKTKKGKNPPKPKKIADPPQSDPVTYKPYDKVELYKCSGFEILKEEESLDVDELELELQRLFEANTLYEFSMEKNRISDGNDKPRRESRKDNGPISNDLTRQITDLNLLHEECIGDQVIHRIDGNKFKLTEPSLNTEDKDESNTKVANIARNFVESIDFYKNQGSQRDLQPQEVGTTIMEVPKEKQPKIKLIWTFLGSQSQLPISDNAVPLTDPKCPGLGCFYHPYFNLGNHCKKEEHINHAPNLGEILIPEGVWLKKFNHRKNEWRSMVEWYIPFEVPMPNIQKEEPGSPDGFGKDGEALSPKIDKGKRKKSIKEEEKDNNKGEGKSKVGKVKDVKGNQEEVESSKNEDDFGKKSKAGAKGKEKVESDEQPLTKADKAVQVPDDLEEVPEDKDLDSQIPSNLRKELTLGTILLRPLIGRKLADEQTPVEEWKWPRKFKVWGSVEMYMVEKRIGTEELDWVFWGKSLRICDSPCPKPPLDAKLKFMHPKDAKVDVPGIGKEGGEEPPLLKGGENNSKDKGEEKSGIEDGVKKKKAK